MRPKNRVYCIAGGRSKMLFETEKKALTFIKFNKDEIEEETGYAPIRAYYCDVCFGWHVTHIPDGSKIEMQQQILQEYNDYKEKSAKMKAQQAKERKELLAKLRPEYREHNSKILLETKALVENAVNLYENGEITSARKVLRKAHSKSLEIKKCEGISIKEFTKIRHEIQLLLNAYTK